MEESKNLVVVKERENQFFREISDKYHAQLQLRESRVLDGEKRVEANAQKLLDTMTNIASTMAAILGEVKAFAGYKEAIGDMNKTKVEVKNG